MSNYLIKNRCLGINGKPPFENKLGEAEFEVTYHLTVFPSGEYPDRLFIKAHDCRLSVDEVSDLRDFLDDWLSQYDLDIKKSKNLNSKVIKALRYIEK